MNLGIYICDDNKYKDLEKDKLINNINIIKKYKKSEISNYILKIYKKIFNKEVTSIENIYDELLKKYNCDYIRNMNSIGLYDIIISSSHDSTYYFIKELNKEKKSLTVICFDMHCDVYDNKNELWKGNHFSKLMKEGYINTLICYGIPRKKIKMTLNQIDKEFLENTFIACSISKLLKALKKTNSKQIIFSLDVDCFNTYKKNYTAIPYSPYRILNELSHKKIENNIDENKLNDILQSCVFIKNKMGYENMYHVGENYLTIKKFKKGLNKIINYCIKKNIEIGYKIGDRIIFCDICEVEGEDINNKTLYLIDEILKYLKEVKDNESIISKKIKKNASIKSII